MNSIHISGNLTREPELQGIQGSDYSVIKFAIANNDERRKLNTGQYENIASFFDCEYWTKNPQHWMKQLYKGTPVVIEGRLKQEKWEKDGQTRYAIRIIVQSYPIVAAGKDEKQTAPKQPTDIGGPESFEDDQIPF